MSDSFELKINRRDFLKLTAVGTLATAVSGPQALLAKEQMVDVWVLHGKNNENLMKRALQIIQANGGFGKDVKSMALKVNAAWDRTPAEGANTDPVLVKTFLLEMKKNGVQVSLPEHSCDSPSKSFVKSGIFQAAQDAGFKMMDIRSAKKGYQNVDLPEAKSLKKARIWGEFLTSDAVVNMPVIKHHSGATMTGAMKNWMGAVRDRGFWHQNNLHQCIADVISKIKPVWTIADATRVMLDNGPKGPGKQNVANLLILSKDQVAVDAYAANEFFKQNLPQIQYLKIADGMGLGTSNLEQMKIHKEEV